MTTIYHVGVSGGKDSGATLLWMVHESGIDPKNIRASFCDTGNEDDRTYEHVRMLSRRVHPIEWVFPKLSFYDLAKSKGRFPSAKARFCTQELKMKPSKLYIDRLLNAGYVVIAVSGIRADESAARSKLLEWGGVMESYFGVREWRPLLNWTIEDVFLIHKKYGVPMNPLYEEGATRVGCQLCIMSRKSDIRRVSIHSPEYIQNIRRHESAFLNGNNYSTFFARNAVPERFRTKKVTTAKGKVVRVATIDDVVEWSMTGHRAQGISQDVGGLFEGDDQPAVCPSHWGACE